MVIPETSQNLTRRLRRKDAAAFLTEHGYPIAVSTLAKLATVGGGPMFRSYGRIPLYTEHDLLAWGEARLSKPRRSTSDMADNIPDRPSKLRKFADLGAER